MLDFIVKNVNNYLFRDATPAARQYGSAAIQETINEAPTVVTQVGTVYATYQTGGVVPAFYQGKDLAKVPAKMLHHYQNYQYLNSEQDGLYTKREVEDGFILISDEFDNEEADHDFVVLPTL